MWMYRLCDNTEVRSKYINLLLFKNWNEIRNFLSISLIKLDKSILRACYFYKRIIILLNSVIEVLSNKFSIIFKKRMEKKLETNPFG